MDRQYKDYILPGRLSPLCLDEGTPNNDTSVASSPLCEARLRLREKLWFDGVGDVVMDTENWEQSDGA